MSRCHTHVFPTIIEGFGRNITEAIHLEVLSLPMGPHLSSEDAARR